MVQPERRPGRNPRHVRKDSRGATNSCKEARKDVQLMTVHVSVRSISALLHAFTLQPFGESGRGK